MLKWLTFRENQNAYKKLLKFHEMEMLLKNTHPNNIKQHT